MTDTPQSFASLSDKTALEDGATFAPRFGADGMIPAIVTDAGSGEVLMFAWMNALALRLTIETGVAHFWSRSRAKLWKKGEESGNLLTVADLLTDCDQDVLLVKVAIGGAGRACHTGERSCFYRRIVRNPTEPENSTLAPLEGTEHQARATATSGKS